MTDNHAGEYLDTSGEWRPENPKLAGSGIVACRPQVGDCPGRCSDCFFRGGRYYEDITRPHIPDPAWANRAEHIVRMNDGNDSNHQRDLVIETASHYERVFFNTRIPCLLFSGPVVLTVNGDDTDNYAHLLWPDTPGFDKLMAVRVRVNTWNLHLVGGVVAHYRRFHVPVRLTYMAYYHEAVADPENYQWKKRTLNSYWVIKPEARARIEDALGYDGWGVHACTAKGGHLCRDCGMCQRVYERWVGADKKEEA